MFASVSWNADWTAYLAQADMSQTEAAAPELKAAAPKGKPAASMVKAAAPKVSNSKVKCRATQARYVWVVNELEPNSNKPRRQWSPHMDSLSETVDFKHKILMMFAYDKVAREDCGLTAGIPAFEYLRTIVLGRFYPRDHHLFAQL